MNEQIEVRLRIQDVHCDHRSDENCECSDYPECSVEVNGLGGYGSGQFCMGPDDIEPKVLMKTMWGEFESEDYLQAARELKRKLSPINPNVWVYSF